MVQVTSCTLERASLHEDNTFSGGRGRGASAQDRLISAPDFCAPVLEGTVMGLADPSARSSAALAAAVTAPAMLNFLNKRRYSVGAAGGVSGDGVVLVLRDAM